MMSLVKWKGNDSESMPMLSNLLENFFGRDLFDAMPMRGMSTPAVNICDKDDEFVVEVAAPGMKKEDFKVDLDSNVLTISSEKEDNREENDEKGNYRRREFNYQMFRRSFTLPSTVDAEKIRANYRDGVLELHIPKREEAKAKPPKRIEIE